MKIREASIYDFQPLFDLLVESEKSEARFDLTIKPSKESRENLKKTLKRDLKERLEKIYFVVDHKGELIGFAYVNKGESTPDVGWIGEIFVKEGFRRRGVATKLIERATLWFKKYQKKLLRLAVHRQNERARRLYKKIGFYKRPTEYFTLEKKI